MTTVGLAMGMALGDLGFMPVVVFSFFYFSTFFFFFFNKSPSVRRKPYLLSNGHRARKHRLEEKPRVMAKKDVEKVSVSSPSNRMVY